jgi:hypothetical protein
LREVIVYAKVHNILWQTLEKKHYDKLVDWLFDNLPNQHGRLRARRHPDDERLFVFELFLRIGGNWHTFEFHVDDTMADTSLFVVAVHH